MKMSMFNPVKVRTLQQIQAMRQELGLAPIVMGFLNCFKCAKHFFSEDVKNQRSCDHCRGNADGEAK